MKVNFIFWPTKMANFSHLVPVGAFLNKLLHSLTTKRFFPFPTRNPYYNMNGAGGNVFPIKLCIVGVVGCDERQLKDADQNDKSILDILGRNIFRIPNGPYGQRSKKTRAQNLSECEVFKSIGGNNDAKKMLEDVLAISKRKKILLRKFGLSLPTGVLLYGPPGTGKQNFILSITISIFPFLTSSVQSM